MKEEKRGGMAGDTVPHHPTGCQSIDFLYRVGICASALSCREVAYSLRGRFFLLELRVPYGAAGEARLLGMATGSWNGTMLLCLGSQCSRQMQ